MSYPPSYPGYPSYPSAPPGGSNGYPPAANSAASGIGFESLMINPSAAPGYGQPAGPTAPYPGSNAMPAPGYGAPVSHPMSPGPYGAGPGMPAPSGPPMNTWPMPAPMGFGHAANLAQAAAAFRAPLRGMPSPNANPGYGGAAPAPYATPYGGAPNATPYGGAPNATPYGGAPNATPYGGAPPAPNATQPYGGAPAPQPYGGGAPAPQPYGGGGAPPAAPSPATDPYYGRHQSFHGPRTPTDVVHAPTRSHTINGPPVSSTRSQTTQPHSAAPAAPKSNNGTVKPHPSFNPQQDAESIKKAVGGFGINVKEIIGILSTRSNTQRLKISLEYKSQFGRDLNTDLKYALGGSLENLLIAMMQAPAEYDASELRKAMKGMGTDESVLIEVLCSRTNLEVAAVKQAFRKNYQRDLEKDVQSETSGNFRKFLISLLQANRDETTNVDYGKTRADADALYSAGEKRWGTDESRFNVIFASRSYAQLRATFDEYAKICKYDIEKSVEREMSGDLKNAMTTLIQCVRNTPGYFATKLYKSMKGLGTDDSTLIRIVVTRCEVDMVLIKQEFKRMFHKTLADFIKGDTSGNFRTTLLGLIGESEK